MINALPPAHQVEQQDGELVDNAMDTSAYKSGLLNKDLRWQKRVVDLTERFCTIFIIMDTALAYPSPARRMAQPSTLPKMNSFNYQCNMKDMQVIDIKIMDKT